MVSHSARKLIEKCFPKIKVNHTRQILTGWENLVLEVNGEHVFRFPKSKESENRLKNEIQILPRLRKYLSTPVPDYTFVWKGGRKYWRWFGGYPMLQGIRITRRTLSRESLRGVAEQISEFLNELQAAKILSNEVPIPKYSKKEWLEAERLQYNKIRKTVYPLLSVGIRARSELFWHQLLAYLAQSDFKPTLLHGDLSTENILFDPESWMITGVLDWGYSQVSDPALELAHLFHHKREVGEEVLKTYRPSDSDFENRVQWYVR